jgi:hypothetical protein
MSATIVINKFHVPGDRKWKDFTITGDSSYPTGGYPLDAQALGFNVITGAHVTNLIGIDSSAGAYAATDAYYNTASNKLRFLAPSGAEVASGANVSTISFKGFVQGF